MIFHSEPDGFNAKFEVASCFVVSDGKALFLRRAENKPYGKTWGIPAGKIEAGEEPAESAVRETHEETGIKLAKNEIEYFKSLFVRYPDYDFVYHIFSTERKGVPDVILNPEAHTEHAWLEPKEALKLELIPDEDECIKLFFSLNYE